MDFSKFCEEWVDYIRQIGRLYEALGRIISNMFKWVDSMKTLSRLHAREVKTQEVKVKWRQWVYNIIVDHVKNTWVVSVVSIKALGFVSVASEKVLGGLWV